MELRRVALPGVLTVVAGAAAFGITLANSAPPEQSKTDPAGTTGEIHEPAAPPVAEPVDAAEPTTTVEHTPADEPAVAERGDTGDVNQPAPTETSPPEIAPGNPLGAYEQTPAPPPEEHPTVALPVDGEPTEANQGPPTPNPAPAT